MTTALRFDPDDLMRHEAFVRELARRLVYDAQAAEDVAQQTWLAALQAPVRPLHSMRAWLATIVRRTADKRSGAERTRRRREEAAAPNETAAPSAAEIVEREQARAAVVNALLALPEHYRDVVVLRWFEGLPPRDIARRLVVPVETVRTRHRRAMEQLRNQLDQQAGGDRSAWAAMLLPLVRPAGAPLPVAAIPGTSTSIVGGALLMSTQIKFGAAAVAIAVAFTIWLNWPPAAQPPRAAGDDHSAAAAVAATTTTRGQHDGNAMAADPIPTASTTAGGERELAVDAQTTGAVHVHVTWADDGTPAPDVMVMVFGIDVRELIATDASGTARVPGLSPGSYRTNIMRPNVMWFEPELEQPRFEVVAGVTTDIDLVVPDSLDITGIVVDGSERPIANAEIVSGGGHSAMVVARTGGDGRFSVRDVATRCDIGARAAGLAPSPLRNVEGSKAGTVEVRIVLDQPGAGVEGLVLGVEAQPVAGARVTIGEYDRVPIQLPDGTYGSAPPKSVAFTDEHGRFRMSSVTPGAVPIHVVAAGHAPHRDELQLVPGARASITVHLQPGVTVRGVVRSERGLPVANAYVVTSRGSELARQATTADDGSYQIVDATTGDLSIEVECDAFEPTRATLTAAAGQVLRWDPVLASPGITLHGRVVDRDGQPVADAHVSGSRSARRVGYWSRRVRTGPDGRFDLPNCTPGVPLYLEVADEERGHARLEAVLPEAGEHVLRLSAPSAVHMRGVVLDDRGQPLPNVAVWAAHRHHGSRRTANDVETGAFALGPFPAGDYMVWIHADGFAPFRSGYRTLADNETWDLGELHLRRGGTLRFALVGSQTALADRYVGIRAKDGSYGDSCKTDGGIGRAGPLAAGDYRLQIDGADVVAQIVPFVIREGHETRLDVPVRSGTSVTLQCEALLGAVLPIGVQLHLSTAAGETVLRREIWYREGHDLALEIMLLPGNYRVEATTAEDEVPARVGSVEFEVAGEPLTQRVELAQRN